MINKRYGIPFLAALAVNIMYWGCIGDWASHLKPPETPDKDLVIQLDMAIPEIPKEEPKQEKLTQEGVSTAAGGKTGSILPDLSGKPTPGIKDLNPYIGGNETASVNLKGNDGTMMGNPGSGDTTGPGGGVIGNGGLGTDGDGSLGGPPGNGSIEGTGSYDSSGYIDRIESNKQMPQQAIRRGLEGTVSFTVTFDENGQFLDATMISSSGHNVLDNAAERLVSSSGGIENTTGHSVTITVNVDYHF